MPRVLKSYKMMSNIYIYIYTQYILIKTLKQNKTLKCKIHNSLVHFIESSGGYKKNKEYNY